MVYNSWLMLILAGLMEPVWVFAFNKSNGGTKPIPILLAFLTIILSFTFFSISLKNIRVDTAYIVWVGIGTGSITLISFFANGEISFYKLLFISLILTGVIGLRIVQ